MKTLKCYGSHQAIALAMSETALGLQQTSKKKKVRSRNRPYSFRVFCVKKFFNILHHIHFHAKNSTMVSPKEKDQF